MKRSKIFALTDSSTVLIMKDYRFSVKMKRILKNRNHSQTSESDFEEDFEFSKNSNASEDDASDDDENDEEQ